ncbi:hypothetical protein CFP56_003954 [Quercus suber]|uniref:Uncharacterized protein n=1 Tax=Quercus suber TaxID=58331 RepID=A0AAW0LDB1_QUESU
MEGPKVKAKWLEDRFRNPLPADASEELVQQYAQFYILEMLASNTSEPTLRHGWQAGRRQRQRGHQSSQHPISDRYPTSGQRPTSGRRHTPMHDHTMEEASQTADEM